MHLLSIIMLVCFNGFICGMKRELNIIKEDQIETVQFPPELVALMAGGCEPKQKNILMRVCKDFYVVLKDRKLILQKNLSTVSMKDKQEDIFTYAYANDIPMMRRLLEDGVQTNYKNVLGMTLFHIASDRGNVEAMKLLTDHGADANILKPHIYALHEAVYKGDEEAVKTLLGLKVDPNLALIISIKPVRDRDCRTGLDYIADLEKDEVTPLYIAAHKGHTPIVQLLLDAGAKVREGHNGWTPLYAATKNGHGNVVALLLTKKGHTSNNLRLSLYKAFSMGYSHIVYLLLDTGIHVNKPIHGYRPVLWYAIWNGDVEIVRSVLDKGANIIHEKYDYLELAQKKGCSDIVELLQERLAIHESMQKENKEIMINQEMIPDDPVQENKRWFSWFC